MMTGSQDGYLAAPVVGGPVAQSLPTAAPPPQQHSPASTSSSGSAGYTSAPSRPPVIPYMGCVSPGGTTHFTQPPSFQFEPCYPSIPVITPPNGGAPPQEGVSVPPPPLPPQQCMNGDGGGGGAATNGPLPPQQPPPTLHFHVKPGDPMGMPPANQGQPLQGIVHWVCNMHDQHPISLPAAPAPGSHYMFGDNGVIILSDQGSLYPPPGPPPYSNGTTPPWNNPYYMSPPPPQSNGGYPPHLHPQQQQQQQHYYPMQDPAVCANPPTTGIGRPSKPPSHKRKNRDPLKSGGGSKSTGSTSPSLSVQSTPPQSPVKPRSYGVGMGNGSLGVMYTGRGSNGGMMVGMFGGGGGHIGEDSEESGIGNEADEDQEEKELYIELLSNIRTPKVSDIRDSAALLEWNRPVSDPGDVRFEAIKPIQPTDLDYEVKLSDKGKDGKYRSIYHGDSLNCLLTDLRPNTEYHVRVQANLKSRNLKGGASDTVSFLTKCTVPDQPQPPKLSQRSRTSLLLRWNAPPDNGKHILHFVLETDEGTGDVSRFKVVYDGRSKQCNVNKLQPSTIYKFRLAAVNEIGSSPYSEVMNFATQGSPPSQPQPPKISDITESSVHLLWAKRPCDDEFTLQMEDLKTGHGFLAQYNGTDTEYIVHNLRKNTTYKFKLRAHNEMGASAYSTDVSYTTLPGRPGPPPKPQVKGKVRATNFKVMWNPPDDNGGAPVTSYELEMDGGGGWQGVYRGQASEFLLDELQPGTTYRVRVASVSCGGVGDFSETCFVCTDPVVPGPPSPPIIQDKPKNKLPGTALSLTWCPPQYDGGALVTEYEIDMTAPDNSTRGVYRGRHTECVVASLLPGRPYLFQVRAYNRMGCGPWSQPLDTISGAEPPDIPHPPKVVTKSGTCVSITWDQPINNGAIITGYLLQMGSFVVQECDEQEVIDSDESDVETTEELQEESEEENSDAESVYQDESDDEIEAAKPKPVAVASQDMEKSGDCDTRQSVDAEAEVEREREVEWRLVYSGEDRSVDIKDLLPATQYQFKVCAMNSAGVSQYSYLSSVVTPAWPPAPPHTLTTNLPPTSSSIAFKWKKPADNGDPITGYRIEWSERSNSSSANSELFVERRRARIENLRPDTTYNVRVQAVNSKGRGPLSNVLKAATKPLPPSAPRLECSNLSHNMLKLKWGTAADAKSAAAGTTYSLEAENGKKNWYPVYSGTGLAYKHNKLAENQEYRYRICASSDAGQGPFSSPVTFRTSFAPPPGLKTAPRITAITEHGAQISWSAVKVQSEPLHYKVVLSRGKENNQSITLQTATDTSVRVSSLAPRTEYSVRVYTIRHLRQSSTKLEGSPSAAVTLTTLPSPGQSNAHQSNTHQSIAHKSTAHHSDDQRSGKGGSGQDWSDKKYLAVIFFGFTLFTVFVAIIINELISLGAISF